MTNKNFYVNFNPFFLVIPKNGTIFAFVHNNVVHKINGSYFKMSSHHRSKLKFKSKKILDSI